MKQLKTVKLDFLKDNIRYNISFETEIEETFYKDFEENLIGTFMYHSLYAPCWEYLDILKKFIKKDDYIVKNIKKSAKAVFLEDENGWNEGKDKLVVRPRMLQDYAKDLQEDIGDCDYYYSIQSIGFWDLAAKKTSDSYWDGYTIITRRIKLGDTYKYDIFRQNLDVDVFDKLYTSNFSYEKLVVQPERIGEELHLTYDRPIQYAYTNVEDEENLKVNLILPVEVPMVFHIDDFRELFKVLKNVDKIEKLEDITGKVKSCREVFLDEI